MFLRCDWFLLYQIDCWWSPRDPAASLSFPWHLFYPCQPFVSMSGLAGGVNRGESMRSVIALFWFVCIQSQDGSRWSSDSCDGTPGVLPCVVGWQGTEFKTLPCQSTELGYRDTSLLLLCRLEILWTSTPWVKRSKLPFPPCTVDYLSPDR